jgi:hypothetical protein
MSAVVHTNRGASLAVIPPPAPPFITGLDDAVRFGEVLAKSGYFKDAADASKAAVKVLAGAELGIGPIDSMTGINIVEGKPTLSADLEAKAVKRSKRYNYRVIELSDQRCVIEFYEFGELVGVETFTVDDAKRAQLLGKRNWQQYPKNMLFARALSNGVAFHCPDVTALRIYTPDELGDEDDHGGTAATGATPIRSVDHHPSPEDPAPQSPTPEDDVPAPTATPESVPEPEPPNQERYQPTDAPIGDEAAETIVSAIRGRGLTSQRVQLLLAAVGVEDVRDPHTAIPGMTERQALDFAQKVKEEPDTASA